MINPGEYVAAIRMSDGVEWIDARTISKFMDFTKEFVTLEDENCGTDWVKNNPVVRLATVEIREI